MNPGGFIESAFSTVVRDPVRMVLPDRGAFQFPAPYGTVGIRITNAADTGGGDALWDVGYSYWANMNAHRGQAEVLIFLGVDRQRGGAGPSLWVVDKGTDVVRPVGAMIVLIRPIAS